ncbi:hypothetical protein GY12_10910 [Micrococcus luteus]|nr:hypothetical protein GY12_10910 [Micrococcus luteus]
MCSPMKEPSRERGSTSPSMITLEFGSSRRPLPENVKRVPMPPSTSKAWSRCVAPVAKETS